VERKFDILDRMIIFSLLYATTNFKKHRIVRKRTKAAKFSTTLIPPHCLILMLCRC